jgi:hypothetical protein
MIGALAVSRARSRRRYTHHRRRRTRNHVPMGAYSQFQRVLEHAPSSRRGKVVFKWDKATGDYDTNDFTSLNVISSNF